MTPKPDDPVCPSCPHLPESVSISVGDYKRVELAASDRRDSLSLKLCEWPWLTLVRPVA